MAMYAENLSLADQCLLDEPGLRPCIRHDFQEADCYHHDDANQECDPCTFLDRMAFAQCGEPESLFRRKDLEELCNIWLREHPGQFPDEDFICGSWYIDDWPEFGDEAVVIVQFKTFRICVRADPNEEMIKISTVDIRDLINKYLEIYQGEMVPQCVGYASHNCQTLFQWLIIPVSIGELQDHIGRFRIIFSRDGNCPYDPETWQVDWTEDKVPIDPETFDAISRRTGESLPALCDEPKSYK